MVQLHRPTECPLPEKVQMRHVHETQIQNRVYRDWSMALVVGRVGGFLASHAVVRSGGHVRRSLHAGNRGYRVYPFDTEPIPAGLKHRMHEELPAPAHWDSYENYCVWCGARVDNYDGIPFSVSCFCHTVPEIDGRHFITQRIHHRCNKEFQFWAYHLKLDLRTFMFYMLRERGEQYGEL